MTRRRNGSTSHRCHGTRTGTAPPGWRRRADPSTPVGSGRSVCAGPDWWTSPRGSPSLRSRFPITSPTPSAARPPSAPCASRPHRSRPEGLPAATVAISSSSASQQISPAASPGRSPCTTSPSAMMAGPSTRRSEERRVGKEWRWGGARAEDGIRDGHVTGVQTCALPIFSGTAAERALREPSAPVTSGRIAGRHSGHIEFERVSADLTRGVAGSVTVHYVAFSDDGRSVYEGSESLVSSFSEDTVYEADVALTGPVPGRMQLRATWAPSAATEPARLRFETAADGRPGTFGFARYGDQERNIADLVP